MSNVSNLAQISCVVPDKVFVFGVVCLSVCQQDYRKSTGEIFMKLGRRVLHGPRKNLFGADQIVFK